LGIKSTCSGLAEPIDETHLQGFVGTDDPTGHDEVEGAGESNQLRQPDGATVEKGNAEPTVQHAKLKTIKQPTLRNVNNCLNTNIYSYFVAVVNEVGTRQGQSFNS
jgi:hypothetical protein